MKQRLHELMLEVIDDTSFPVASEKQEWIDQAYEWRLPYWDWGLVELNGIPTIFTTPTIKLRQPRNADGSIAVPLESCNPLNRYQTKDKTGDPLPMGKLPSPYTISDDPFPVLPVRIFRII